MSDEFVRVGPLMDMSSYPQWAQEMVHACAEAKRRAVDHELFHLMREAKLDEGATRNFLVGVWPLIEQFPQYMALNLLKVQYGRTRGQDMARQFLIQNIRVEQKHADHWVEWAAACGITKEDLFFGAAPEAIHAIGHWCWHTCERDTLAAAMAATNYAIEGAAGEWSALICSEDTYANGFEPSVRKKAMKWLKLHAHYDDTHPWEALEIICTIMGSDPTARGISLLRSCIRKSYEYMHMGLDHCLMASNVQAVDFSPAMLMQHQDRKRA